MTEKPKRIRASRKMELRTAYAPVTKWQKVTQSGSGQIAGPTYGAQLARERLAANAQARAAVDAKVKATYYGK